MLSTVLELELVTVDFEPIASLREGKVVAWRLVRRPRTELLAGLPPITAEGLAALADDEGRGACLERLWQKVSLERIARHAPAAPVLVPIEPSVLDPRWGAGSLRRAARSLRGPVALAFDPTCVPRAAIEARLAGFEVAAMGPAWQDARPHWRLVEAAQALRDAALIVPTTWACDAKLVVTGVARADHLRALRTAGVDFVCGAAIGRARALPNASDVFPDSFASENAREVRTFGHGYREAEALHV
ncbi:MAG: hypothetical protein H6721_28995 [Sandaracinus sp.]|nr:hypothetical protein [Sandaracinus sp.]MCB9636168.1 hypothetical protein [Sandaracinus sp.]